MNTNLFLPHYVNQFSNNKPKSRTEQKAGESIKNDYNHLIKELNKTRSDLECAVANFNCVLNPKETDIYIYQIKNSQAKYENILSQLQELENRFKNLIES